MVSAGLTGCAKDTINNVPVVIEGPRLNAPAPKPLNLDKITWIVLQSGAVVPETMYALTEAEYEALLVNQAKIMAWVESASSTITAYKKYYESDVVNQVVDSVNKK